MPRYRIDCGNSSTGPVGFVAVVRAANKRAVIDLLRKRLPEFIEVHDIRLGDSFAGGDGNPIEYLNVYLNGDGISIKDVEEDT